MRRYFITLSFDGAAYHGWQVQPNGVSVQGELQRALSTLLRRPAEVVGAGRTDAGVHARKMVAHFDTEGGVDCRSLAYKLNRLLPGDISVYGVEEVDPSMHARFSATSRTYHYHLHTAKDPFRRAYSYEVHFPLDFALMNEAARRLSARTDFAAFCKAGADNKTTVCRVSRAVWVQDSPTSWHFEITANRFLRNMVRAVVGTLLDIGRGRTTIEQLDAIAESGNRSMAGDSVPGHALFLQDITY